MKRTLSVLTFGLAIALVVAGCAENSDETSQLSTTIGSGTATGTVDNLHPPVFVDASDPDDPVAGVGGVDATVAMNSEGCFVLAEGDSSNETIIVWPRGTTRDKDSSSTGIVPNIGKVAKGTELAANQYSLITQGPTGGQLSIRDVEGDYPGIERCGSKSVLVNILYLE